MMKQRLLHQLVALFVITGLFSFVRSVHAETFSVPEQFTHEGLTFTAPLTYITHAPFPQPTTAIAFSAKTNKELAIANTTGKQHAEEIIITPTSATKPTRATTKLMPTPTLYTPASQADLPHPTTSITPTAPTSISSATPVPNAPPPAPRSTAGGLNPDVLFSMVNSYRQSQGLPAFQQDDKTCSLAASRAPEINNEVASGTMHSGLHARNLPYWNTENIISMNSEQAAFNWWINDPIHHDAIVSHAIYSCVACSGNACAEEFTSYQPK